ncbi:MAG TPA: hypothetical protein VKN99_02285 [Polyangia bacterium]|nr:hypothetical protein [Polyangia bacterium]
MADSDERADDRAGDRADERAELPPPPLTSWAPLYWLVLGTLALVILLLGLLSRAYS